ncbi:MAG TPA: PaaI family thioesterase [Acidimicrobiia bacterium]|nr:PaaI family thioesterase [Acidimicrobiia bacterium]
MKGGGQSDVGLGVARVFGAVIREVGDPDAGRIELESLAPVHPHLADDAARGRIRTAALLGLIDNVGGLCGGLAALPHGWVVSTNLMFRRVDGDLPPARAIRMRSRVLRAGRNAVVTAIEARDADTGTAVADAVLTSSILVPGDGVPEWTRPVVLDPGALPVADLAPLPEWAGVVPAGGESVELPVRDELRNPWGIVHGGMVALLVDVAAQHEARAAGATTSITTDVVLHFLAPARTGPVRAVARAIGARADGRVSRVEVRDRGAADRVVAFAIATARTP